jgi:peroxiredoxin
MSPLAPGAPAPVVPGVDLESGPLVLFFYKVTCPVCQMAAPAAQAFERAYPGRIVGIGQDPMPKLQTFAQEYRTTFASVPDAPPYPVSDAYGIQVVPTVFLVEAGAIGETVESWNRDGLNSVSVRLADMTGAPYAPVSETTDGLPPFRPG